MDVLGMAVIQIGEGNTKKQTPTIGLGGSSKSNESGTLCTGHSNVNFVIGLLSVCSRPKADIQHNTKHGTHLGPSLQEKINSKR